MAKPSYSSTSLTCIKSKFCQDIISPTKQLERWAEYYKDLASDPSGHSLNGNYWNHAIRNISLRSSTWNIDGPITIEDIKKTISSMKNNKAPGPHGILQSSFLQRRITRITSCCWKVSKIDI